MRTYSELITIPDFEERIKYLLSLIKCGESIFGGDRYVNQRFYQSNEWKQVARKVVLRDDAMDLAHPDRPIKGRCIVHHIEPLTIEDFRFGSNKFFDLENLITVSHMTHEAIHFGSMDRVFLGVVERKPNDQTPWR